MSNHLKYYLSIESDLEECSRYVEFTNGNFKTYSIEFLKIIMSASSEIDTLAKQFCTSIDPGLKAKNIHQYADCILKKHENMPNVRMTIPRFGIELKPWESWTSQQSPAWWQGYNSIKHDRVNSFEKASLENALNSVAGLLAIILYYHKEKDGKLFDVSVFDGPKLIAVADESANDDWERGGIWWSYSLP